MLMRFLLVYVADRNLLHVCHRLHENGAAAALLQSFPNSAISKNGHCQHGGLRTLYPYIRSRYRGALHSDILHLD